MNILRVAPTILNLITNERECTFRGTTNRVFTFVYFLNLNWIETDGGKLHLMGEGEQLIAPIHGRLALFHTPDLLHEVTVTSVDRFAVTAWLGKKAR